MRKHLVWYAGTLTGSYEILFARFPITILEN